MNCHCCSGPTKRFGRFENKNRVFQRYRCKRCGKTFSEDQPLQGVTIATETVAQIVRLFTEGVGVRAFGPATLGCTPAVGMKLTDHTWTIEELIERACDVEKSG